MKKIMFNDKYGLTQAVLEGRKTMTRRMVYSKDILHWLDIGYDTKTHQCLICDGESIVVRSQYQVGEVVAIAQSYKDINELGIVTTKPTQGDEYIWFGNDGGLECVWAENHAGWKNKMFVKADLMPHQIKITNIEVEHLQDISDEDCLKEGIYFDKEGGQSIGYPLAVPFYYTFIGAINRDGKQLYWSTPKDAFAALIDKVSGRGTWQSNPLVKVYEFELLIKTKVV